MPRDDSMHSLGRAIRTHVANRFHERAKFPQAEPDPETRRIVREIMAEFSRFGPQRVAAMAENRYGVVLDLDMVRGALAELENESDD